MYTSDKLYLANEHARAIISYHQKILMRKGEFSKPQVFLSLAATKMLTALAKQYKDKSGIKKETKRHKEEHYVKALGHVGYVVDYCLNHPESPLLDSMYLYNNEKGGIAGVLTCYGVQFGYLQINFIEKESFKKVKTYIESEYNEEIKFNKDYLLPKAFNLFCLAIAYNREYNSFDDESEITKNLSKKVEEMLPDDPYPLYNTRKRDPEEVKKYLSKYEQAMLNDIEKRIKDIYMMFEKSEQADKKVNGLITSIKNSLDDIDPVLPIKRVYDIETLKQKVVSAYKESKVDSESESAWMFSLYLIFHSKILEDKAGSKKFVNIINSWFKREDCNEETTWTQSAIDDVFNKTIPKVLKANENNSNEKEANYDKDKSFRPPFMEKVMKTNSAKEVNELLTALYDGKNVGKNAKKLKLINEYIKENYAKLTDFTSD